MNKEAIKLVRDHIAELPESRFNMGTLGSRLRRAGPDLSGDERAGVIATDCGTCACIAGWACALLAPETRVWSADQKAGALFGLQDETAYRLFFGNIFAAQEQAVATLDHLIATGEVDWDAWKKAPAINPEGPEAA